MDPILSAFSQIAAGERIALILFAVMALLAISHPTAQLPAIERLALIIRARPATVLAWRLIAGWALTFSPFHAAWLLGTPSPPLIVRASDAIASGCACGAMIAMLAASAIERGITADRVRRGTWVNIGVLAAVVFVCLIL